MTARPCSSGFVSVSRKRRARELRPVGSSRRSRRDRLRGVRAPYARPARCRGFVVGKGFGIPWWRP
jgi:hypothetical protein